MSFHRLSWESLDLQVLPKNFSYEENYHRKFYYPKLVYERIRQRQTFKPSNGSAGSLSGISSSSSVPDLLEAFQAESSEVGLSEVVEFDDRREHTGRISRTDRTVRRVPFSLGESVDEDSPTTSRTTIERDDNSSTSEDSIVTASITSATTMNEQELLDIVLPPPRRRSSSLRRAKSPGSPTDHRKKAVHFADALGLELRSVKHIVDKNAAPVVPATALRDMRRGMEEAHKMEGTRYVCACFTQPGDATDFLQRVNSNAVVLERCFIGDQDRTVSGVVRVANLCYRKLVTIRYTTNNWVIFDDLTASYVLDSNDGATDRFSFSVNLPKNISVGGRLQLAVRYDAIDIGRTFWDSNFGDNYCFECYARAVPTRESDFAWMHFL